MINNYSEKEIEIMKDNVRQIVDFLTPLKKETGDYLYIPFGNISYGEYEYKLCFNPCRLYGSLGRIALSIEPDDTTREHSINDNYYGPDFMAKLCRDWQKIKSQIMSHIENQRELKKSIVNFEL